MGIKEDFLKKMQKKRRRKEPLRQKQGSPGLISDELIAFVQSLAANPSYKYSVQVIRTKIDEFIEQSKLNLGQNVKKDPTKKYLHSITTFRNIMKKIDGKIGMAERTTDSRYIAERDILNAISLACTNCAMLDYTNPHMILNCDATQFNVGGTEENIKVVYVGKRCDLDGPLKCIPGQQHKPQLAFFIKYYMVITAAGDVAPPIYILQSPQVPKDDMDVHKVYGLGFGGHRYGYIVFSHSRTPSPSFYKWVLADIMIPMIADKRSEFPSVCKDKLGWIQMDGEIQQIGIFTDEEVQSALEEGMIEVGKLPAAYTAIGQPCDTILSFSKHLQKEK